MGCWQRTFLVATALLPLATATAGEVAGRVRFGGLGSEARFLPVRSNVVVSFNLRQIEAGALYPYLFDRAPVLSRLWRDQCGAAVGDLERVTLGGRLGEDAGVFLFVYRQPPPVFKAVAAHRSDEPLEMLEWVRGRPLFTGADGQGIALVDAAVLAAGPVSTLREILTRQEPCQLTEELETAAGRLNFNAAAAGAVALDEPAHPLASLPLVKRLHENARHLRFQISLTSRVELQAAVQCSDGRAATALESELRGALDQVAEHAANPALRRLVDQAALSVVDNQLHLRLTASADLIAAWLNPQ